ncbi:hypothetical protein [Magnetospira sp. QH-2]|uniref:hypothetical protein n=1 Tax=Magnetospira sp. (strain QH-2) TaxID=1288970 RepID=UPI0003E80ED4|nr:hypothetical protein [Magnetospira sp. QH-2]CCQ74368.1 protein of unknown function [Magnetospira sp. QH-2]
MDWEAIYEEQLIPLVETCESEDNLWKCIAVVVNELFKRKGDEEHKKRLVTLFHQELSFQETLQSKIDGAVRILRYTKERRKELARAAAAGNTKRAEGGADVNAAAKALGHK